MTVPTLGNTPGQYAPSEFTTDVWKELCKEASRPGGQPVIMFWRPVEFREPFAPKKDKPDHLVNPVKFDLYFPNGPRAGQVHYGVDTLNAGMTGPMRQVPLGSIHVGQLALGAGSNGPYPQVNALDADAYAWAAQVHQAAKGDVFAAYGPREAAPVAPLTSPAPAAPVDRFAGMAVPTPGQPAAPPAPPAVPAAPANPVAPTTVPAPAGLPWE